MMDPLRSDRSWRAGRALALVALAGLALAVAAPGDIRVTPLARDGRILVSFELPQGIGDDTMAAIHSGLATTFAYDVELRRGMPLWFDRSIDQAEVAATVQYDNLRRRHQLSRSVNGRMDPNSRVTEDEDEVRRWLTKFDRLSLFSTGGLEANAEYYVRVRARTHARDSVFVWPWGGSGISGLAKFTFIP